VEGRGHQQKLEEDSLHLYCLNFFISFLQSLIFAVVIFVAFVSRASFVQVLVIKIAITTKSDGTASLKTFKCVRIRVGQFQLINKN